MKSSLSILLTNDALSVQTGTSMVVRDLTRQFLLHGHTPILFSPTLGPLAEDLRSLGATVVNDLTHLSVTPDIIHGHHARPALTAMVHFTRTPGLFVCHDRLWKHDRPPKFSRFLRYVAVDENCRERLVQHHIPESRIRVIHNAVDLSRFLPRPPLPSRPKRALVFSNYAHTDTHLPVVEEACRRAKLDLDVVGMGVGKACRYPEEVLGHYDLVFAKARCALEAMAVGCAVILCDSRGIGPMVTGAQVEDLRHWNFGMRTLQASLDPNTLELEIRRYNTVDAARVSQYIRDIAGLANAAEQWLCLYDEILKEYHDNPPLPGTLEQKAAACYRRRVYWVDVLECLSHHILRSPHYLMKKAFRKLLSRKIVAQLSPSPEKD